MKTLFFLLGALLLVTGASAKSLEITVPNVRSDKGTILVMAQVAGQQQQAYGKADAQAGAVVVTLDIAGDAAEVSLFHDENDNFQMDMGDRGPTEGYATRKCKLDGENTTVKMNLFYPAKE